MEGIRIPIGAPLDQLTKDLNGANKVLKGFTVDAAGNLLSVEKSFGTLERQLKLFKAGLNASTDVSRINTLTSAIKATEAQLRGAQSAVGGIKFAGMAAGSNSAAFALQNLGRVAQDAPFGFIGIQNNLNPLLESFQRLRAESTSNVGALKALGASLIGPAGLGIAFSVVSAAILFYQQYQQKANRTTENAKKTTDDYANSLGQVAQAQLKGAQSAQSETTTLSLLYKQYTNNESSLKDRKTAYDQLQKLYPSYFGNIKFERDASDQTKLAYDRLTSSILATSRARAAGDLITKNSQRQLENEQKLTDLSTEFNKANTAALKAEATAKLATSGTGEANERISLGLAERATKEREKVVAIQRQINNLVTDSIILQQKNLSLEKSVNIETSKGGLLSGSVGGSGSDTKSTKIPVPKFDRGEVIKQGKFVGITLSSGISEGFTEAMPVVAQNLGNNLKLGLTEWQTYVNSDLLPKVQENFTTFFNDILMRGKLSFDSLGKAILNTFLSVIASDAAAQLTSLLQFKEKGVLGKSKGGILSGLAGLLGIGGKAAAGGGAATVAGGTAATGGALIPILAGIAAVAGIASLFKKKQPAQVAPVNYASSASMSSVNDSFSGGRVVFEISGVNLIGVLNRAGAKLKRFGP